MDTTSTVLIVEDDRVYREDLRALLAHAGYGAVGIGSGEEALAQARQLLPDLVLLDVMMPGLDGFEVCRRLRAEPLTAEVPIILVTALDDREARIRGFEAGADDFVSKPIDRIELRARVRTTTRLNRYRKLLEERARLAQLIDLSPVGIAVVDADGNLRLANPALCRFLDLAAASAWVGRGLAEFLDPAFAPQTLDALAAVLAGGAPVSSLDARLIRADGSTLAVEIDAAVSQWDRKPMVQMIVRDITDRRRSELLEGEKRHIAYELHDGLAQMVAGTHQHLQAFAHQCRLRSPAARQELDQSLQLAHAAVKEVRRVLAGLRPTALDDFGLVMALRIHAEALAADGWDVDFAGDLGNAILSPDQEMALFRVAQEALNNVRKHAEARSIQVRLSAQDAIVRLDIADDGKGFTVPAAVDRAGARQGLGLHSMEERLALVGGRLAIQSGAGAGVRVVAELPLTSRPKDD